MRWTRATTRKSVAAVPQSTMAVAERVSATVTASAARRPARARPCRRPRASGRAASRKARVRPQNWPRVFLWSVRPRKAPSSVPVISERPGAARARRLARSKAARVARTMRATASPPWRCWATAMESARRSRRVAPSRLVAGLSDQSAEAAQKAVSARSGAWAAAARAEARGVGGEVAGLEGDGQPALQVAERLGAAGPPGDLREVDAAPAPASARRAGSRRCRERTPCLLAGHARSRRGHSFPSRKPIRVMVRRQAMGRSAGTEGDGMRLVLLTKYNAAIPGRAGPPPGLDAGWLAGRLALFEAWTLPSVRAQTRRPDAWLVFVDAATDPASLAALGDEARRARRRWCRCAGPLTDARIGALVGARLCRGRARLLSLRLDSDDAIAADYLARMEAAAAGWRGFVNAPLGYRVCGGAGAAGAGAVGAVPGLRRGGRAAAADGVPGAAQRGGAARAGAAARRAAGVDPGGAWRQPRQCLQRLAGGCGCGRGRHGAGRVGQRGLDGALGPRALARAVAAQLRHELAGHLRGIGWSLRRAAGGAP